MYCSPSTITVDSFDKEDINSVRASLVKCQEELIALKKKMAGKYYKVKRKKSTHHCT